MHVHTTLLALFALVLSISATPLPMQPMPRAVPNIDEVARNPAPIDDRVHWENGKPSFNHNEDLPWEDWKKLNELIHDLSGESAAPDAEGLTGVKTHAEDHTKVHLK